VLVQHDRDHQLADATRAQVDAARGIREIDFCVPWNTTDIELGP
jgi:hypothetical protein